MIAKISKAFCLKFKYPLITIILQSTLIYLAYILVFQNSYFYSSLSQDKVRGKMKEIVNQCGDGYFASWLVIKTNSPQKYSFKDVIGCNKIKGKDCAFSVKDAGLNPFYSAESHQIDKKTFELLDDLNTGDIAYYDNISDLQKYSAISDAMKRANSKIQSIGFTVVKDFTRNLVYVFTISKDSKNPKCDNKQISLSLRDLSLLARGGL